MSLSKIPKPQAGGSDRAGREKSVGGSGKSGGGGGLRKSMSSKKPAMPSARPMRTAGRLLRRGGRAAAKGAGAAANAANADGGSGDGSEPDGSNPRSVGQRVAGSAGAAARKTGQVAKKVAGKTVRAAGRAARRGLMRALKWLLSTPWGWIVLIVLLLLGFIVGLMFFVSAQQFARSFMDQNPDDQQVSGGGGVGSGRSYTADQVHKLSAADSHDTTDLMAKLNRNVNVERLSYLDSYPAGETHLLIAGVRLSVNGSEPQMIPGGALLAEAIPDEQTGMIDLVEWMLPQWVAPYPVMVAAAENVEIVDGTWPDDDGVPQPRRLLVCDWPDTEWSSLGRLAEVLPDGTTAADVRIEGPWYPEQQHICHLLAAAEVVWEAWKTTFGDDGFVAPFAETEDVTRILDLNAVRRLWLDSDSDTVDYSTFTTAEEADLAAFAGDLALTGDRLWSWLSFAAMLAHKDTPIEGQYDCSIMDGSLKFGWEFMGDYAASGGTDLGDGTTVSPPEEFFAEIPDGSLMVPWPCPKPVLAAAAAAKRGMWVPVGWAQNLADFGPNGSKLVNGLDVSDEALTVMSRRGFNRELAEKHGETPKEARNRYVQMIADMPEPFDPEWMAARGEWSQHSDPERDDLLAWCAPDTRWVSETAELKVVNTEPLKHPKSGLVDGFAEDNAQISDMRSEGFGLLNDAKRIRDAIAAEIAALHAAIAALQAEGHSGDDDDRIGAPAVPIGSTSGTGFGAIPVRWVVPVSHNTARIEQMLAQIAALEVELAHANTVVAEMELVVDYWDHATTQAQQRPQKLHGPTWQYECETDTYEEALKTLELRHGDNLPDEASPLRTVFTTGGAGKALGTIGDHTGGQYAPLESMLRLAYASGLLPEPVAAMPHSSTTKRGYVSPTCSADDWLKRDCLLDRSSYYGTPILVLPKSWADSRIPSKCPPIYRDQSGLLDSLLGETAAGWDTPNEARMVSSSRDDVKITAYHPCLKDDIDALVWLTHMVGMPYSAFGWRSFEHSAACAEASPGLCADAGQSRHNYGLAIDIQWERPECWPPPDRHDESCPPDSAGTAEMLWCGLDHGGAFNPDSDLYLTTPATVGGSYETADGTETYDNEVPEEFRTNWCWQLMDLATFGLSGLDQRLALYDDLTSGENYPIVGLHQLPKETWHWSYDTR